MLLAYVILVIVSFIFAMIDLFKTVHFRGYAIPSRTCYDLSLLVLIMLAMKAWYVSSVLTILLIIVALFMIGLLETAFRNKLQNRLSKQLIIVVSVTFVLNLMLSIALILF